MAENETPQGAEDTQEAQVETPAETDWKAEARKWESRAKENLASARANEDAAKRLAELEDAQKSEAQKQQEALEKAQRELAELTVAKTRAEVAAAKGVPAELLTGSTQEELEAAADALNAWRGEPAPQKLVIPNEGKSPDGGGMTIAEQFAAAFDQ